MAIGPMQIVIILVIVILLFGTKRLRNLGSDLGTAIKGFKKSVADDDAEKKDDTAKIESEADKTDSDSDKK